MKNTSKCFIGLLLLVYTNKYSIAQQNLIFYDEFNGSSINDSIWATQPEWGPNIKADRDKQTFLSNNVELSYNSSIQSGTAKLKLLYQPDCYDTWRYPEGCSESDCYVGSPCDNYQQCSNQQNKSAFYQGGHCLFVVPKHFDYTAGMLFSQTKFQYGTFEMRCKVPKYSNPSFWLYGSCCEEIDIFEFFCNEYQATISVHECPPGGLCDCSESHSEKWWSPSCNKSCGIQSPNIGVNYTEGFHTYRLEWTSSYLRVLIDGAQVHYCEESGSNACLYHNNIGSNCSQGLNSFFPNKNPMNLIVNVAVDADNCTPLSSSQMEIDYIKVWSDVPPLPPDCNTSSINISGGTSSNPLDLTASGGIYPQTLRASDFITTSGFINVTNLSNDPDIFWSAGNYIEINSGFETVDGAAFIAEIAPCNSGNRSDSSLNSNHTNSTTDQLIQNQVVKSSLKNEILAFISPNPTSGIFSLSLYEKTTSEIFIYNNLGELIYNKITNSPLQIDLISRPKGTYFLKVQSGDKLYTEKVIVQ